LFSQANGERNQVKVSRDNSVAELATLKADFHQLNLKLVALQRENEHQKVRCASQALISKAITEHRHSCVRSELCDGD
jgi:hypothetical protein